MKRVFLSYAHDDAQAVQTLRQSLRDIKVSGWMDQSDIATGGAIAKQVRESLRQSSAVIVVVSKRSLKSQWVKFEVGAALGMGKRIIPIVIGQKHGLQVLPDWLQDLPYIDARGRPMQDVADEIKSILLSLSTEGTD
jgi:TIR domain